MGAGVVKSFRSADNDDGTFNVLSVASEPVSAFNAGDAQLVAASKAFFTGMESTSGIRLTHEPQELGTLNGVRSLRIRSSGSTQGISTNMVSLFMIHDGHLIAVNGTVFRARDSEEYKAADAAVHSYKPD
ncbi:MAG: hypothetical protein R3B90_11615 [Planctomycetaceae bacterium]